MAWASSLTTNFCGPCPPVISRIARAGSAPIRRPMALGRLSALPKGATAVAREVSNWRMPAMVSMWAPMPSTPASATAACAARPGQLGGRGRRIPRLPDPLGDLADTDDDRGPFVHQGA